MKSVAAHVVDTLPAEARETVRASQHRSTLLWSMRREIWQHRSLYAVPLLAAAVLVSSFLIGAMRTGRGLTGFAPYHFSGAMLELSAFLAGSFYCIEAMHGERRDRSILFWKSLPVSDSTAVLAKALMPLVFLPVIVFLVGVGVQLLMLIVTSAYHMPFGLDAEVHRITSDLTRIPLELWCGITMVTVLQAPIYGWLLLASAWARRAPLLWAVLPPLGLCVIEKMSLNSTHLAALLGRRLVAPFQEAFSLFSSSPGQVVEFPVIGGVSPRGLISFLTGADVWIGLLVTVAFVLAAARLRRDVEPH